MAKALLGYRPVNDQRLMLETLELRRRVSDLEHLVERLQRDNEQLREDMRLPAAVGGSLPTMSG